MTWVQVATADELAMGQMKPLFVGQKKIVLYHVDEGFYATSDVCTHSGRLLSGGGVHGQVVTCPAHGGKFDVKTGKAKAFPCVIPVRTYDVELRGNEIWIHI